MVYFTPQGIIFIHIVPQRFHRTTATNVIVEDGADVSGHQRGAGAMSSAANAVDTVAGGDALATYHVDKIVVHNTGVIVSSDGVDNNIAGMNALVC